MKWIPRKLLIKLICLCPSQTKSRPISQDSESSNQNRRLANGSQRGLSSKVLELVSRLSQSKEVSARIAQNKAPKRRSMELEQSLRYGRHRRGLSIIQNSFCHSHFLFFWHCEFEHKLQGVQNNCFVVLFYMCISCISEMAALHDHYNTLKDCRYIRFRSNDQLNVRPFDINEIFGKKD